MIPLQRLVGGAGGWGLFVYECPRDVTFWGIFLKKQTTTVDFYCIFDKALSQRLAWLLCSATIPLNQNCHLSLLGWQYFNKKISATLKQMVQFGELDCRLSFYWSWKCYSKLRCFQYASIENIHTPAFTSAPPALKLKGKVRRVDAPAVSNRAGLVWTAKSLNAAMPGHLGVWPTHNLDRWECQVIKHKQVSCIRSDFRIHQTYAKLPTRA